LPRSHPLSFEQEAAKAGVSSRVELGLRTIRVKRIVGSAGKAERLRSDFVPPRSGHKWETYRIMLAKMKAGEQVPPITVYQLRNRYFVIDGHTRVAVAKALGIEFLDADVTEAVPSNKGEINQTYHARREFERYTGLEGIRLTAPWRYHLLHHHVEGYRLYLERSLDRDVSLPQAARIWYRSQYEPTLMEVRRRKLTSSGGGRTSGDVYTDILRAWAEEGLGVSLREMLDRYDHSLSLSRATRARRLARGVVDAALPKAVGPLGKPRPEQLANLDVEAELEGGQEDER
jgi:hypothetical protein